MACQSFVLSALDAVPLLAAPALVAVVRLTIKTVAPMNPANAANIVSWFGLGVCECSDVCIIKGA
jgi:hypothetical protein